MFSLFITAHNYCLEIIWIYCNLIYLNKSMADLLLLFQYFYEFFYNILRWIYCIVICKICKLTVFNKENKVIYTDIA